MYKDSNKKTWSLLGQGEQGKSHSAEPMTIRVDREQEKGLEECESVWLVGTEDGRPADVPEDYQSNVSP